MAAERPISDKPEPKLTVDLIVGLIEEQLETGISPRPPKISKKWDGISGFVTKNRTGLDSGVTARHPTVIPALC